MSVRRLFNEKHKADEILFQEGGSVNINDLPLPKHHMGKGHTILASHVERDVVGDAPMQPKSKPP